MRSPAANINGVGHDSIGEFMADLTVGTSNWLTTCDCGAPRLDNADDVDEASAEITMLLFVQK
jgi:hypothetical protein